MYLPPGLETYSTERLFRKIIQTYAAKAGIDKRISTHTLRYTFVSDLLRENKNFKIVQKVRQVELQSILGSQVLVSAKVTRRAEPVERYTNNYFNFF